VTQFLLVTAIDGSEDVNIFNCDRGLSGGENGEGDVTSLKKCGSLSYYLAGHFRGEMSQMASGLAIR
jgi:hypothetical protein